MILNLELVVAFSAMPETSSTDILLLFFLDRGWPFELSVLVRALNWLNDFEILLPQDFIGLEPLCTFDGHLSHLHVPLYCHASALLCRGAGNFEDDALRFLQKHISLFMQRNLRSERAKMMCSKEKKQGKNAQGLCVCVICNVVVLSADSSSRCQQSLVERAIIVADAASNVLDVKGCSCRSNLAVVVLLR